MSTVSVPVKILYRIIPKINLQRKHAITQADNKFGKASMMNDIESNLQHQMDKVDEPVAIDLTEAVEDVYRRVMDKTNSALSGLSSQLSSLHSLVDKLAAGQNTVSQTVDFASNADRNTGLAPVDPAGRNAVITADLLDTRVSDTVSVTSQPISLLSHSAYSRSNNNKRPAPSLY